jgi:hypothetical protein
MAVVQPDVGHDFVTQVGCRVKDATTEAIPRDHTQPDLHLVQPRGVGGGEVQMNIGVEFSQVCTPGVL